MLPCLSQKKGKTDAAECRSNLADLLHTAAAPVLRIGRFVCLVPGQTCGRGWVQCRDSCNLRSDAAKPTMAREDPGRGLLEKPLESL